MSVPEAEAIGTEFLTDSADSISDKRRRRRKRRPEYRKDDALVADILALRYAVLRAPAVTERLTRISALRPPEIPKYEWTPKLWAIAGLYYDEVRSLVEDLEGLLTFADVEALVRDNKFQRVLDGSAGLSIGTYLGRGGRGRRMTDERIERVASALALRADRWARLSITEADVTAAASSFGLSPQVVAVDRKRMRDRLS